MLLLWPAITLSALSQLYGEESHTRVCGPQDTDFYSIFRLPTSSFSVPTDVPLQSMFVTLPTSPSTNSSTSPPLSSSTSSSTILSTSSSTILNNVSQMEYVSRPAQGTIPINLASAETTKELGTDEASLLKFDDTSITAASMASPRIQQQPITSIKSDRDAEKEVRFMYDYSSFDAGGKIVDSSRYIKNVKAIQKANPDLYMTAKCSDPSWVIVALPEQIYIQFIAFESRELFSSFYGKIAIMGSGVYPKNEWILLTIIELDESKSREVFDLRPICENLKSPSCWITHLKFEVISYYPMISSQFCTLTRFQAFGSTLLQGLHSKVIQSSSFNKTNDELKVHQFEEPSCPTQGPHNIGVAFRDQDLIEHELLPRTPSALMTTQPADLLFVKLDDDEATGEVSFKDRLAAYRHSWDALINARDLDESSNQGLSLVASLHALSSAHIPSDDRSVIHISPDRANEKKVMDRKLVAPEVPTWPGQTLPAIPNIVPVSKSLVAKETSGSRKNREQRVQDFNVLRLLIDNTLKIIADPEEKHTDEQSPPLLALVDRVDHLEQSFRHQHNSTITQFAILKSLIDQIASQSSKIDMMRALLELSVEKTFWTQSVLSSVLGNEILSRLLLVGCKDLLQEFSWGNRNGKRQICLAANLIRNLDMVGSAQNGVVQLQRTRRLVDDLGKVNLRIAVECRLRRLQFSLGESEEFSSFTQKRLSYLEDLQEASDLYRQFLKGQVNWFGLRQLLAALQYSVKSVEHSMFNAGSMLDMMTGTETWVNNGPCNLYRWLKSMVTYTTTALEGDPILTYLQIILLEAPCFISINRILGSIVVVLVLDNALRTRDAENAIRDLQLSQTQFASTDPGDNGSVRSDTHPSLCRSPSSGTRNFKAFSAPPSATRVGGGLTAALAHSLQPINRYWGPLRKRYMFHRGPTDSAASDSMEERVRGESSEDEADSPQLGPSVAEVQFAKVRNVFLVWMSCQTCNESRRSLSARDGIRKLGETIASLGGFAVSETHCQVRHPRLPRQAPTIFYSLLEPQTEAADVLHSEPPPKRTDDHAEG
eukprot:Gregarina_sp_Poly_1__7896@NODE_449_length_8316_cov_26_811735_g367_i0_p1_GENE_NODE_449_length_8316_cov_26_811735_g367_i0NODE_449_length_8316_cov_26_811735_g367_i0_p1_ORF_typecomplete_len1052_score127_55Sad1_UNC/PF07738_13/1_4e08_NODE_449_length_8316_cov_26_811735_g367_i0583213